MIFTVQMEVTTTEEVSSERVAEALHAALNNSTAREAMEVALHGSLGDYFQDFSFNTLTLHEEDN